MVVEHPSGKASRVRDGAAGRKPAPISPRVATSSICPGKHGVQSRSGSRHDDDATPMLGEAKFSCAAEPRPPLANVGHRSRVSSIRTHGRDQKPGLLRTQTPVVVVVVVVDQSVFIRDSGHPERPASAASGIATRRTAAHRPLPIQ